MVLSREEREQMVLDLYYNKGYTYRQIAKELRMSPNQIREIIKRHEEKNDATASKRKMLSLSSQAYKLFSKGNSSAQVAIKLDLPQEQVTQYWSEYCTMQNQDEFKSLYMLTKNKVSVLWKIYKELMVIGGMSIEEVGNVISTGLTYQLTRLYRELVKKRGMSIEEVAAVVDVALNDLPYVKEMLEQTSKLLARKQVELDMLEARINSLKEEENRRRNRIFTLPSSSYYIENSSANANPYYSSPRQSPSLPYWPSGNHDPWGEYRDKENTKTRSL
jgi:transposase